MSNTNITLLFRVVGVCHNFCGECRQRPPFGRMFAESKPDERDIVVNNVMQFLTERGIFFPLKTRKFLESLKNVVILRYH